MGIFEQLICLFFVFEVKEEIKSLVFTPSLVNFFPHINHRSFILLKFLFRLLDCLFLFFSESSSGLLYGLEALFKLQLLSDFRKIFLFSFEFFSLIRKIGSFKLFFDFSELFFRCSEVFLSKNLVNLPP
nr:MAG TPA: hypothetical protein [Caudoviricetes sp.]